jgi:hypothetical protein
VGTSFGSGGGGSGLGGGGGSGINFFGLRSMIQSVVFVVDVSASMVQSDKNSSKNPRTYGKLEDEVGRVIGALDPMAKFGLVTFSHDAVAYRNGLTPAHTFEKRRAMDWMKKQSPAEVLDPKLKDKELEAAKERHRGTHADDGLKAAFAMKPDTIFFVSDGEPTGARPADVLKEVADLQKTLPRPVKIHVIAFVPDDGEDFMRSLASQNGGEYRVVNLNEVAK